MRSPFSDKRTKKINNPWRRTICGAIFIPLHHMITDTFFAACAVAGLAVVWRNWLVQHKSAELFLQKQLGAYSPILTCGSCFTYWLSLAFVLFHDPLARFSYGMAPHTGMVFLALRTFISWMALAYLSVLLRFSYILVQERVSLIVHAHDTAHSL